MALSINQKDRIIKLCYPYSMIAINKQHVLQRIHKFIFIQLFLTLISLPVLICWGFPLSLASPLANFLFGPVLSLFLLLSSLIFFCELFWIPNGWLIKALEHLTSSWLAVLNCGYRSWLLGINKPPAWIFIALLLASLAIIHAKKIKTIPQKSLALLLLLIGSFGIIGLYAPLNDHTEIPYANNTISIIRDEGKIIVFDPGVLGKRQSAQSWVQYTLLSELNKRYGTTHIDHLILSRPGTLLFQTVEALLQKTTVGTIYLPWWEGSLSKNGWRSFFAMQRLMKEKNVRFIRIKKGRHILTDTYKIRALSEPLKKGPQGILYTPIDLKVINSS